MYHGVHVEACCGKGIHVGVCFRVCVCVCAWVVILEKGCVKCEGESEIYYNSYIIM